MAAIECTPMPPGRGGWSEWQEPILKGYLMQCCDCGLVHEVQFRVLDQTTPTNADGEWGARVLKTGRVSWRMRRVKTSARR